MIVRLRGTVLEMEGDRLVLSCAGVGYEVQVPASVAANSPPIGSEAELFIRQIFREDAVTLFGFSSAEQRRLFDLLGGVKGCGPKTAAGMIGELGEETVLQAVATQDAKLLVRATGVGPRLSERIILELRDRIEIELARRKLDPARRTAAILMRNSDDLVEALLVLGYRRTDAEDAAASARIESEDLDEQIRLALKVLKR